MRKPIYDAFVRSVGKVREAEAEEPELGGSGDGMTSSYVELPHTVQTKKTGYDKLDYRVVRREDKFSVINKLDKIIWQANSLEDLKDKLEQDGYTFYESRNKRANLSEGNTKAGGYPFAAKAEQYSGYSVPQLLFAFVDARTAATASKGNPEAEGWYYDDVSTIRQELLRRNVPIPENKDNKKIIEMYPYTKSEYRGYTIEVDGLDFTVYKDGTTYFTGVGSVDSAKRIIDDNTINSPYNNGGEDNNKWRGTYKRENKKKIFNEDLKTPKPKSQVSEEEFIAGQVISYKDFNGRPSTAQFLSSNGVPSLRIQSGISFVMQPVMNEFEARSFYINLPESLSEDLSSSEYKEGFSAGLVDGKLDLLSGYTGFFDPTAPASNAYSVSPSNMGKSNVYKKGYFSGWKEGYYGSGGKMNESKKLNEVDVLSAWADYCHNYGLGFDLFEKGATIIMDGNEDYYGNIGFTGLARDLTTPQAQNPKSFKFDKTLKRLVPVY